jgi:hypothetical protein
VNSKDCGHIFPVYSDLTRSIHICRLKKVRHIFGKSFSGILSKDIRDEDDHIISKINLHDLACVQVIWKCTTENLFPEKIAVCNSFNKISIFCQQFVSPLIRYTNIGISKWEQHFSSSSTITTLVVVRKHLCLFARH